MTPGQEAEQIEQILMRITVRQYVPPMSRDEEAQAFVRACQAQRRPRSEAETALRGIAKRHVERRELAMLLHPSSGLSEEVVEGLLEERTAL